MELRDLNEVKNSHNQRRTVGLCYFDTPTNSHIEMLDAWVHPEKVKSNHNFLFMHVLLASEYKTIKMFRGYEDGQV